MERSIKFNNISGQDEAVHFLKSIIVGKVVPKPLLLSGIDGVGKEKTAFAVAAFLNCLDNNLKIIGKQLKNIDACGICRPCKMLVKSCHPDVLHIKHQEPVITVNNIKSLLERILTKSYESENKILIIPKAQRMNDEASNVFLKFLEEHGKQAVVILTASSKVDLASTLASRCHNIKFKPLDDSIITGMFSKKDLGPKITKTILNLSAGNLTIAKELVSEKWIYKRKWLFSIMSSLCINNLETQLWIVFSEILSKFPEDIDNYLVLISFWLRDILIYKIDPKRIYNLDTRENIALISKNINYDTILNKLDAIQKAQQDILESKLNLILVIDAMLVKMFLK